MDNENDKQDRRIERLEERVNNTERELAALSSKLHLIKDELSRRIVDINENLKADVERTRIDLRERIAGLKEDLEDDINRVNTSIGDLNSTVTALNKSLQNLYITQQGASTKVRVNEKIIWAIIGLIGSSGLYVIRELLSAGAG